MRFSPSSPLRSLGVRLYRRRGELALIPILFGLLLARPRAAGLLSGAALMVLGEALRLWGVAHLGAVSRSRAPQAGTLVTSGPFARTRHPLYLANLLLTLGFAVATGAGWPWFPAAVATAFLILYAGHARREEEELSRAFPKEHAAYRTAVPALGFRFGGPDPVVAGCGGSTGLGRAVAVEAWTLHAEVWLWVLLWLRIRYLPRL